MTMHGRSWMLVLTRSVAVGALPALLAVSGLEAREGAREDTADRAADKAAQAAERAARDEIKIQEERIRIDARLVEDMAKAEARSPEEVAKVQARAAEEVAKLEADAAEEAARREADAAKEAADLAERAAKDAEDAQEEDHSHGSDEGSSSTMQTLAESEEPEFDAKGFPVRRGEIVALDLSAAALDAARTKGFVLVSEIRLQALGGAIFRFRVPAGMTAPEALGVMRSLDANGSFDLSHYYGLNVGVAGSQGAAVARVMPRKRGALKIGMIDTAVTNNAALGRTTMDARNFTTGAGTGPTSHGTAIASLLASEGTSRIVAANVFRSSGSGQPYTSADAIVRALEWMVEKDVRVINVSLAGPRNLVLDRLISRAIANGTVIVAAAGNGGPAAPPAYPAAVPGVVAVTAVDSARHIYRYANQGSYIRVAALGVDVAAASPRGTIVAATGTSFATPHVAATLARCLQAEQRQSRQACIRAMEHGATDLGAPGKDPVYGFGLIE